MTADLLPGGPPTALRLLDGAAAGELAGLCATFEELQTVLRCCEHLVAGLDPRQGGRGGPDGVSIEAAWTVALLSYARCFRTGPDTGAGAGLTEEDVTAAQPGAEVLEWHQVLMRLRDHYADPEVNPREHFSVGVAQDELGAASGVAITSTRQPLVDEVTVRQLGAIAYALSTAVDARIASRQEELFAQVKDTPPADLDKLEMLDLAVTETPSPEAATPEAPAPERERVPDE